MFYAETDTFTGDNPKEHTHGFANTKEVIAFRSKAARDEWVSSTKLMTARAVTRSYALKESSEGGNYPGTEIGDRFVRVYGELDHNGNPVIHLLKTA